MKHLPDETLSALVDQEPVDGFDAAHVDDCAECRARLDALRQASAAVRAPVALPAAHVREAAVAAALVETSGVAGTVRRLAMARRVRAHAAATSARRVQTVSVAAAVLVALGAGGWLLSQAGGRADSHSNSLNSASALDAAPAISTTAVFGSTQRAAGGSGASGGAVAGTADAATVAPEAAMGYQAGELGEFNDIDELAAVAQEDLHRDEDVKAQHVAHGSPCPLPPNSEQLWTATITFNGKDAAAWVRTTESGRVLEVLDVHSACAVVANRAI